MTTANDRCLIVYNAFQIKTDLGLKFLFFLLLLLLSNKNLWYREPKYVKLCHKIQECLKKFRQWYLCVCHLIGLKRGELVER